MLGPSRTGTVRALVAPLLATLVAAAGPVPRAAAADPRAADPLPQAARDAYAVVLKRHVTSTGVDYVGLAKRSRPELAQFLAAVAEHPLPEDGELRTGHLIDAYNGLVLEAVLHHERPHSVLSIPGFFDERTHRVGRRTLTLDALEKGVLRPHADDPRTHFALVCAARGCPELEARPFFGRGLAPRLEAAARRYLSTRAGAREQPSGVAVSKLFSWYGDEFGGPEGLRAFLEAHLPGGLARRLRSGEPISFFDYDWGLNQSR